MVKRFGTNGNKKGGRELSTDSLVYGEPRLFDFSHHKTSLQRVRKADNPFREAAATRSLTNSEELITDEQTKTVSAAEPQARAIIPSLGTARAFYFKRTADINTSIETPQCISGLLLFIPCAFPEAEEPVRRFFVVIIFPKERIFYFNVKKVWQYLIFQFSIFQKEFGNG